MDNSLTPTQTEISDTPCTRGGAAKYDKIMRNTIMIPGTLSTPIARILRIWFVLCCLLGSTQLGWSQACDCTDYVYLVKQNTAQEIVKYIINGDGSLTEVGSPWASLPPAFFGTAGVGTDANGRVYSSLAPGDVIRRFNCLGDLDPLLTWSIPGGGGNNLGTFGNTLFVMSVPTPGVRAYDLCTQALIGEISLTGAPPGIFDWGLQVLDDGSLLITSDFFSAATPNNIYLIQPTLADFMAGTPFGPLFTSAGSDLTAGAIWGVTTDGTFIYVVEKTLGLGTSTIHKYDMSGNSIGSISDVVDGNTGFFDAIGIVFSEASGRLYVSTQGDDDLIAIIDTTGGMSYVGVGAPPDPPFLGGSIHIATECCPNSTPITIDTTVCNVAVGDSFLLQDLIPCDGPLCEGTWTAGGGNMNVTFNPCQNSVRLDDISGCGTFTLTSDGLNANAQCAAFSITFNIDFTSITSPTMSADQLVCPGEEPDTLFAAGAASPTALTFQWQSSAVSCFGPFLDIPLANDTFFVPGLITDTMYYRMISTAPGGCGNDVCRDTSACITVFFVDPACNATSNGPVCAGDDIQVFENGGDAIMWSWSSTNGGVFSDPTAQNPTVSGVVDGETFTVTITDVNGCTSTCTTVASVRELPGCAATNSGPICAGETLILEETGGDAVSWSWSSDMGATITDPNAMVTTATNVSNGETFTVTVTDANGCSITCSTTAVVNLLPACTATTAGPICAGGALQLNETGGDAVLWNWSSSGFAVFSNNNDQNPIAVAVTDGEVFTVMVTDANGCTSTCQVVATVNPLPACNAINNGPICAGQDLMLTENGGDAMTWSWSSNGGATFDDATSATPVASGAVHGEVFTVVVTDMNGCTSSCSTMAIVNDLPGCAATNSGPICDGETLTLEETAGDAVAWSWSSDMGATIADPSAMITSATGVSNGETFTVVVTDANGCTSMCTTVAVVDPLPACAASTGGAICEGGTLSLMETGGDAVEWTWSSDGGASFNDVNDQNPSATNVADGEIFTVIVTDVNGCTSSCTVAATVNEAPACNAVNSGPICAGEDLGLEENGGDAVSWSWSTNGSATFDNAALGTPVASGAVHGEIFTVTVTDMNGCTSTCTTVAVVNDVPGCAATNSGPICAGQTLTIEETGGDAVSWSWSSDMGATIDDASAMVTTATGVSNGETFTVIVTDANGCTSMCTTTAVVNSLPACTATNGGPICDGDDLPLMESGGSAVSWSWSSDGTASFNNVNAQNPIASGVTDGEIFTVIVTDANGCTSSCSTTATVDPLPACTANNNGPICDGDDLMLSETGGDATSWSWTSDGSATFDDATSSTPIASNVSDGEIFTVVVTDANGCTSSCTTVATVNPLPACTIDGEGTQCENATGVVYTGPAGMSSYLWSISGAGASIVGSTMNQSVTVNLGTADATLSLTITDANGCESSCDLLIEIIEPPVCTINGPTAVCPDAQDVQYIGSTGMSAYSWSVMSGDAVIDGASNQQAVLIDFGTSNSTLALQVTDANGCTSTCTLAITVADNDDPVFLNCPVAIFVANDPSICGALVNWPAPVASDNCDDTVDVIQIVGPPPPAIIPVNTPTTITYLATDDAGNTTTCSFMVMVIDSEVPNAQCQDTTIFLDGAGMASIAPLDVDGASTDNCGIASRAISQSAFDCSDVGPNNVTLVVTDVNGNTGSCVAEVTVVDTIAPTFVCPGDMNVSGCVGEVPDLISGLGGMDNCDPGGITFAQNPLPGVAFGPNPGDTIGVIITATDVNGNTSTCVVVLTIVDTEVPVFVSCPFDIVTCNLVDFCGATAHWSPPVAVDNCDDTLTVVQTLGPEPGSVFAIGITMIEYEATDDDGNVATCSFMVMVADCQRPDAICQDIEVFLDGTGNASIVPAHVDGGSFDNCGFVTLSAAPLAFTCADAGLNNVVLIADDLSGNSDSCVATVLVRDVIPPAFECPMDMDVSGCVGEVPDLITGLMGTDNCGGDGVTFSQNPLPGVAFGPNSGDTINVIITATDANGNTSTCSVTLTILDNEMPVFVNCPSTIQTCNDIDTCGATVNWSPPVAVDNCDDTLAVTQIAGPASGSAFPVGTTTITYQATDDDGNTATCTFDVIVEDCQNPDAICQNIVVALDGGGNATITAADIDGGSFDNCMITSLGAEPTAFDCSDLGPNNVTLVAMDAAGNADSCVAQVTVIDTIAPSFTCPADMSVSGCVGVVPDLISGLMGTDDCGGTVTFSQDPQAGVAFGPNSGDTIDVVITATDESGNTSTCAVTLTILDDEMPVFVNCLDSIATCNDIDTCGATVNWAQPVAVDNCDDTLTVTQIAGPASGSFFPLGPTTITYQATDDDGNTTTCSFEIIVTDCQNPDAICQDIDIYLDATGMATITAADVDGGSFDNCSVDALAISDSDFDCGDVGNNNVTLVVTDPAGNIDSCIAQVTVNDTIPPTFTCPADMSVSGCSGTVPDLITGLVVDDNCGVVTFIQDPLPGVTFGPNANDTVNVLITATDASGNQTTCIVTLTIIDDELPVFVNCPTAIETCTDIDECIATVNWFDPVAVDNCDDTLTVTQIAGPASGSAFPVGTTTITYMATDDDGNATTCSFDVIVTDCQNPSAICQDAQVVLDAAGNGAITPADIDGGSFDNCAIDTIIASQTDFTCADLGDNNVTLVVIDTSGNADSCVATVTVLDLIPPQFTCPADLTVDGCSGTVPDLISGLVGTDNCGGLVTFSQDPQPNVTFGPNANDTVAVIITATDESGNTATCEVILTIIDDEDPVFVNCPTAIDACNDIDDCGAIVNWFDPVAVDNCDDTLTVVQTTGLPSGSFFPIGAALITYEATDDNGNVTTCTFVVTVSDCQNPSAICQDVTVELDASGTGSTTAGAIDGGSFDNCAIDTIIASTTDFTCADVGGNNVTLVVIDTVGNADSCVATVTVIDLLPPQFTCPADMTVDGCSGTVPDLISGLVGTDNCGAVTFSQDPLPDVTFGPNANDTIAVVITATDVNGNTATCEVILTIIDDEIPVFVNCPTAIAVCNDVDACGATVNWSDPVAVDNCDDTLAVVQTTGLPSGSFFPIGNTLITYEATDDDGNTTTCMFVVTVSDCQNPSAICQDVIVELDALGMGSTTAGAIDGGSFDNCAIDTIIASATEFTCADVGDNNVTLVVIDTVGNADSCVATVTVVDLLPPQFTCPADMTVDGCSGTVPDLITGLMGTDNCGAVTFSQAPAANVTFGPNANDTVAVTITATDVNGNTTTCEVILTIIDDEDPVFVNCPDSIDVCNDVDECGATVNWSDPVAVDNCDDTLAVVQTTGLPSGSFFPIGSTLITYEATDDDGNMTTCTFIVTVSDCQNPSAICQDVTVELDAMGMGSTTAGAIDGGSFDNCAIDTLIASATDFTCADVGDNNVTLVVIDTVGNADSCVATVTVVDILPPQFTCPADMTVDGCSGTVPDLITGLMGTDNCGAVTFSQDPEANVTFGPNANDTVAVTITATDANGNTATCEVILTIIDDEVPVFVNCPDTIDVCNDVDDCGAIVNWLDPIAVDNCDDTLAVVQTTGLPSGSFFPIGSTLITYEATDDEGNATTCTFIVTVSDCQNPSAICEDATVQLDAAGMASITAADVDGGSFDNCAIDTLFATPTDFTCADVGDNSVTLIVIDTVGNADSCVATVTVEDILPPQFTCPADMTVDGCSGTVPDLISGLVGTDNCGPVTFDQNPLPNVTFGPNADDTIAVVITATDANGNTATCEVILTIIDDEDPVFVNCPTAIDVCNDVDECGAIVNWSDPVAVDNCDDTLAVIQTGGLPSGSLFPIGSTLITYEATDDDGNATTCTFIVTVSDCQNPSAICQDVQVLLDADGMGSITVADVDGGSFDNCAIDTIILSATDFTCADVGDTNVTMVVIDTVGNADSCVAEITVLDLIPPQFTCPADLTVSGCSGSVPDLITGLTATDNCGDALVTFSQNPLPNVAFDLDLEDTLMVIITATDINGNTTTCEVDIILTTETLIEFLNCPDTLVYCNDVDTCGAFVNWFDPIAQHNCDDSLTVVQTGGPPSGSFFPLGATLITYVASDNEGNSATCTFIITVDDCQNPNAICQTFEVFLDGDGMATISAADINGGSYDNCVIDTLIASQTSFTCDDVGLNNVTLLVIDSVGHADSCIAEVIVSDTIPPAFACPADLTVTGCSGTVPDLITGLTGTDNCDDAAIVFTQDPLPNVTFGPDANDTIDVIVTATDANGNTATCAVTLTITDNEDPIFVNCPDTIAVTTDPGLCGALVNWFAPIAIDNCDDTMNVVQTQGPAPGSEFPVGITQVVYTATDDEGNSVSCTFLVVVSDTEVPEAVCQDIFVYVDDNCEFVIGAADVDGGSTDNCGVDTILISRDGGANFSDSVSFTIADLADPFVQVILQVTDSAGNTAQCVATVTVIDAQDPMVICQADITVNTEPGHCHGIIPNIIPPFDTTDNCAPVVNLDQYPEEGLLFGTAHGDSLEVFLIATDIDGNMDTCSLFIFLNDVEAPEWLNCPRPPIVQKAMPAACGAFVNFSPPIALDNCELDTIIQVDTTGLQTGDMFPVGITILQWIAIDIAGNVSDTCEYKIIVNDAQPPTVECPADVIATNDPGECGAVVNDIAPVVTDNCPDNLAVIFEVTDVFGNTILCDIEDASGTLFPVGENTVTYRVYDQPLVLITEVVQSGADMLEITNFGPASVDISCLTIERLGAGAESAVIADGLLAPGDVYVHAFANDIGEGDGAEYQISVEGTVHDVVATNGFAASGSWSGTLDGGDVWRFQICDHDDASDWNVADACATSTIGVLNPGLPVFPDNGAVVGLQSQLPNIVECSFMVTVNDVELPFCTELNLQLYQANDIPVAFDSGDCATSIITIADNFEVGQLNVLDLIGTTTGGVDALTVELTSPAGTSVVLFSNLCAGFEDFDLDLSDTSLVSVNAAPCGPLGLGFSYMPEEALLAFCGEDVNGDWTLSVQSDGASGSLTSWSLQFLEQLPWAMNDTILDNDPGECGGVFTWTHAAFGDNCCEGTIRVDYETLDDINVPAGGIIIGGEEVTEFFEVGTTTVIYTLTDQAGNTSQCEFDVTVLDAELPELVCPADIIVNLDPGACATVVNFLPDLASDNCGIIDTISDTGTFFDIGNHTVTIVVTDAAGNSASCTLDISILEYVPEDDGLTCNNSIQLSLDQNCEALINADMILEGDDYRCYDNYCIYVIDANGDTVPNALLTLEHVDQCFTVSVVDCLGGGNSCWGEVCVEEKIAPEIECPPDTVVACNQSTDISITGQPEVLSCEGGVVIEYVDDVTNFGECNDPRVQIIRTWTVTDESGNSTTCQQIIEVAAFDESEISWPPDFVDANAFSCDDVLENPLLTDPSNTGEPMINGESIFGDHYCEIRVATWDKIFIDANCSGSYTILRYWEILNDCEPISPGTNPFVHIQVIEVNDNVPPELVCPQDFTISADPWFCVTQTILPLPIAYDGCSELGVVSIQVSGGSLLNMGSGGYILANLEPEQTYTVTIKVKDECKNTAECTYTVTVVDDIAPVPICDEHTVVSLIEDGNVANGLTKVPVTTFDDGSYDNCGPITIEARRMTSCIDFDWTTNGAGFDDDPNGVVTAADRGMLFGPYVPFACCDAGVGSGSHQPPVMVQVRITDAYGNVNFCMVEVEVQDKLSPYVECLPNIEVSCDFWFEAQETNGFVGLANDPLTPVFGTMLDASNYDEEDRQPIIIDDPGRPTNPSDPNYLQQPHQWGIDGWSDDNCETEITVRVRIFEDCAGNLPGAAPDHATRLIERTFRARDGQGNSSTCVQRIWVVDFTPFYISDETCTNPDPNDGVIWPCDRTFTTCPDEIPVDYPVLDDNNCTLIGVDYSDEVFEFVDGACLKILRTWTVIDWCQYDAQTGEGIWHYVQIIKVLDNGGPIFTDCPSEPVTLCVESEGAGLPVNNQVFLGEQNPVATSCSAHILIEHDVRETCSDVVSYDVKLFPFDGVDFIQVLNETEASTDSNNIATLVFDSRSSHDLSIRLDGVPYNNNYCTGGPKDYHRILWTVEDGCGNISTCSYLLRVEDCKKPTPVCVGLQSVVMPSSGSVTIWASDFDASSIDDCTPFDQLLFSFSGENYTPSMEFDCEAIEQNGSTSFIIEIWVADAGNDSNCNGTISWDERNKDFCTTFIVIDDNENVCPGTGSVGGEIQTEEFEPVESVFVNMMDELGLVMQTYVTNSNGSFQFFNPLLNYSIEANRNDDHRNGVSSLDLVRIQKHLLGLQPFTSPYKLIAADANNSASVSAVDLVEIRKVILGVNVEFPNNQSWRFVDADQIFADPEHPWPFDEVIELENLTLDENFVAIKVGDVNGTVVANAHSIETRNVTGRLMFDIDDRSYEQGETIEIEVRSSNFQEILGYQFTLRTQGLELMEVKPGELEIDMNNFGVHADALTTSWHSAVPVSVESDAVLFTLVMQAQESGTLRQSMAVGSRITRAEAYREGQTIEEVMDVAVTFTEVIENQVDVMDFALFQNEPNPATSSTTIGFTLPEPMRAEITLYNVTGQVIRTYEEDYLGGYNEIFVEFDTKDLESNVIYYRLEAGDFSATKKMIIIR